jgi:hypothetical protein
MDSLDQWQTELESLIGLWRSIRVACVCLRAQDTWINLFGCIDLSTDPLLKSDDPPNVIVRTPNLLAIEATFPPSSLPRIIDELRAGQISRLSEHDPVKLFVDASTGGFWGSPRTQDRTFARRDMGIDFTTFLLDYTGPQTYLLFAQNQREEIDKKLRVRVPPFNGLAGLARSMRLVPLGLGASNTYLRLSASLPLRFKSTSYDLRAGTLTVRVEAPSFIDLSQVHVSGVETHTESPIILGDFNSWQSIQNTEQTFFEKTIEASLKEGRLGLFLAYKEAQADVTDLYLSSVNAWTRACEFFDPGLRHAEELMSARNKMTVSALELGALRILALVGFHTAWFGKKANERKSDILACHELEDGRRKFLLVECTEENPTAKFGAVALEAATLRTFLADGASEVTPCVYTAIECSEAERQNAVMHGIALLGPGEASTILEIARKGQPIETILAFISSQLSNMPGSWLLHQFASGPVGPTG